MRFTDTHCHFDFPPFVGDEPASIARAAEAGVERIIVPAVEASRFARIVSPAAQHSARPPGCCGHSWPSTPMAT